VTSVKEFRVDREPTDEALGRGRFVFTDDYSVFDWGRMPDEIPGKGQSLCTMGADNFERLEDAGVPTHYRGVGSDGKSLAEAEAAPREMAIDLTVVPDLPHGEAGYDYDAFHDAAGSHYLVPLEKSSSETPSRSGRAYAPERSHATWGSTAIRGPTRRSRSPNPSWSSPASSRSRTGISTLRRPPRLPAGPASTPSGKQPSP
jgi:Phosphoribosylaminoimidazolesuccinocarboxamide (SAICAR) synthase